MSPSSSTSDHDPFAFLVATGPVAEATTASAWLQAMLDVESALAGAQATAGVIPQGSADAIKAACDATRFDVDAVFTGAAAGGNPVIALLPQLRRFTAGAGDDVHHGATSQDIVDTAAMLIVRRCSELVIDRLDTIAVTLDQLAGDHAATAMIGRTLLQHALPTTFGSLVAAWTDGLKRAAAELRRVAATLPVQLGGPVGDQTALGPTAVVAGAASRLGLVTAAPWHAQRTVITGIAGVWGTAASAVAGVATDIVLLASSDIGELAELAAGSGGSSSMPHKHNAIAAVSARAAAMQAPGYVATLLHAAGAHELQRAAGAWHAEWPALRGLLRATGSAIEWLATSVSRLVVDDARMAANLGRSGD